MSGIYQIQSKRKPERIYIGSAVNIHKRWGRHLFYLRKNKHPNKKLQRHYSKYGEVDLMFLILLGCEKIDLLKVEQYFLDSYRPYFNNSLTAGSTLGLKHSEETRKKISETLKGKHPSEESRQKMRHPKSEETRRKISLNNGMYSEEARKKVSEALKGKHPSEEARRKMSEAHKGEKHPMFGRHHTKETKLKISKNHADIHGRKHPMYGKHHSEETKRKMSTARLNRYKKQKELTGAA